jgi:HAMP domain-containing protein
VNCREARDLADPFLGDQLLVETTQDIVRHLETCPACREEFASRRLLRTRLQSAIDTAPNLAPHPEFVSALRARLRPADAPRQVTRRAWLQSWAAAAAALAALLGGGLFARDALRRSRLATLAATAAGDHQNCAIKFNLHERPIPLEEAARRYDAAFSSLTTIAPPGGAVLDRHSCVFDGRRFGHVVFQYKGRVVSLLVTGGSGLSGATPVLVANDSALRVAAFDVGMHAVFVVSDLPDQDTLRVAQALADPLRQALPRS